MSEGTSLLEHSAAPMPPAEVIAPPQGPTEELKSPLPGHATTEAAEQQIAVDPDALTPEEEAWIKDWETRDHKSPPAWKKPLYQAMGLGERLRETIDARLQAARTEGDKGATSVKSAAWLGLIAIGAVGTAAAGAYMVSKAHHATANAHQLFGNGHGGTATHHLTPTPPSDMWGEEVKSLLNQHVADSPLGVYGGHTTDGTGLSGTLYNKLLEAAQGQGVNVGGMSNATKWQAVSDIIGQHGITPEHARHLPDNFRLQGVTGQDLLRALAKAASKRHETIGLRPDSPLSHLMETRTAYPQDLLEFTKTFQKVTTSVLHRSPTISPPVHVPLAPFHRTESGQLSGKIIAGSSIIGVAALSGLGINYKRSKTKPLTLVGRTMRAMRLPQRVEQHKQATRTREVLHDLRVAHGIDRVYRRVWGRRRYRGGHGGVGYYWRNNPARRLLLEVNRIPGVHVRTRQQRISEAMMGIGGDVGWNDPVVKDVGYKRAPAPARAVLVRRRQSRQGRTPGMPRRLERQAATMWGYGGDILAYDPRHPGSPEWRHSADLDEDDES